MWRCPNDQTSYTRAAKVVFKALVQRTAFIYLKTKSTVPVFNFLHLKHFQISLSGSYNTVIQSNCDIFTKEYLTIRTSYRPMPIVLPDDIKLHPNFTERDYGFITNLDTR